MAIEIAPRARSVATMALEMAAWNCSVTTVMLESRARAFAMATMVLEATLKGAVQKMCSVTFHSIACRSVLPCSVHVYAHDDTDEYIYIYIYIPPPSFQKWVQFLGFGPKVAGEGPRSICQDILYVAARRLRGGSGVSSVGESSKQFHKS